MFQNVNDCCSNTFFKLQFLQGIYEVIFFFILLDLYFTLNTYYYNIQI